MSCFYLCPHCLYLSIFFLLIERERRYSPNTFDIRFIILIFAVADCPLTAKLGHDLFTPHAQKLHLVN
jgi:hypothetical protein